ncbi:MAG: ABC transporter permease, partial [Bryobacteraceae bacterium]
VYVDSTRGSSRIASDKIRAALDKLKEERVRADLARRGVDASVLQPFAINRINTAPERKRAGFFWGMILGYVILILMFTGGMYPAIDMTAGEKERRTLEAFLASPVGRSDIVLGKILSVMTAALVTGLLSIASMFFSFRTAQFGRSPELRALTSQMPLDPATFGQLVLALLPLALMAASIMVAIGVFAKTYKEAQSYLTTLIFVVLFPAIVGMVPGIEFNARLALIPIFNVSQLIKTIFLGEVTAATFAVTFLANAVYSAIAFSIAVRFFRNENVLFRV